MKQSTFLIRALRAITVIGTLLVGQFAHGAAVDQARLAIKNGDIDAASRLINQAIENDPDNLEALLLQGVLLAQRGEIDQAEAVFTRLTKLNSNVPPAFNNLAAIQASRGEFEEARNTLIHATKRFPNYLVAHENLADLHTTMAAASYQKALQIEPNNARVQSKLEAIGQFISLPVQSRNTGPTPISVARQRAQAPTSVSNARNAANSGNGCPRIGPLASDSELLNMQRWLDQYGVLFRMTTVSSGGAVRGGKTMVYLPPANSLADARSIRDDLLSNGITDIGIIRQGDLANAISLGVFSQPASVERRREQLRARGFEPLTRALGSPPAQSGDQATVLVISDPNAISVDELRAQFPNARISQGACAR